MSRAQPAVGIKSFAIWATVVFGVLLAFSFSPVRGLSPTSTQALLFDAMLAVWLFAGHYLALRVRDSEMRQRANVQPD